MKFAFMVFFVCSIGFSFEVECPEGCVPEPKRPTHFSCGTRTAHKFKPPRVGLGIPEGEPPLQSGTPVRLGASGEGSLTITLSKETGGFSEDLLVKVSVNNDHFLLNIFQKNLQVARVSGSGRVSYSDFRIEKNGSETITIDRQILCWQN